VDTFVSGDLRGSGGSQCMILLDDGIFKTVTCFGLSCQLTIQKNEKKYANFFPSTSA